MATEGSRRDVIKGLGPRSHPTAEEELAEARASVLRWWWEFLRLSRAYWMVCQTSRGHRAATEDERLAKVYEAFGDVWSVSFDDWWMARGYDTFREMKSPPRVKEVSRRQHERFRHRYESYHVWVDIPLMLSRATITRQISKILEQAEHQEHRLSNRLERSHAKFKLTAGRHRLHTLGVIHDVYCLHRELIAKPQRQIDALKKDKKDSKRLDDASTYQTKADIFRIGKLLKLAVGSIKHGADERERRAALNRVRATVGRYLTRANQLIENVEIGNFPSYDEVEANPLRFNRRQLDQHKELEEQWWDMNLHATMTESRVLDAKRIHYDKYF
jgi:hypothetical protein